MNNTTPIIVGLLSLLGCTDDIGDNNESAGDGSVTCEQSNDGLFTATIDASSEESWVYLDLTSCMGVTVDDPQSELSWDMGFQRFNPKINGGVSGSGGMEAATLSGAEFDSVTSAPASGYVTDAADENGDDIPEYALGEWFDYDIETHILTPADQMYVLNTVDGDYVKLQFEDYYDEAGTSGIPQVSWAFIDEPSDDGTGDDGTGTDPSDGPNPDDDINCASGTDKVSSTNDGGSTLSVINSESTSDWTCFSFSENSQVDTGWDIAWKQYEAVVSSTINGLVLPGTDYDSLDSAPDGEWAQGDTALLDDWYVYSGPPDHVVTPAEQLYLLEDTEGTIWKMEITSYYKDGELGQGPHHPNIRWEALSGS